MRGWAISRVIWVLVLVGGLLLHLPIYAAQDRALSTADSSFLGESPGDQAGHAIDMCSDLDGDGLGDLVIAAPFNDEASTDAGKVYLVLGSWYGWTADTSLASADGSFLGEVEGDRAGTGLSCGGDVNGDGLDDLLVGAPYHGDAGMEQGRVYLFLGSTGIGTHTTLADADALFDWTEGTSDWAGEAVDIAPDLNGDGLDDILIGSPEADEFSVQEGRAFLILGRTSDWEGVAALTDAAASFYGETSFSFAGRTLAGTGDLDGDGYGDLLIGAQGYPSNDQTGRIYLFEGSATGTGYGTPVSSADASFDGEVVGDLAGRSVAGAGDVDGDGLSDFLVGAPHNEEAGSGAPGQAYLFLGASSPWSPGMSVSAADASFIPVEPDMKLGWSVSTAGDTNADGLDDFLVGASNTDNASEPGAALLYLGRPAGWAPDSSTTNAHVRYGGETSGDFAGTDVTGGADVDGDGTADISISAPSNDQAGADAGKVYVILGAACVGTDADGDGWTDCEGDCDDSDAGLNLDDADGDGFTSCGDDCDDLDASVHPYAPEICDGIPDNDCDGFDLTWDEDVDGDGWTSCMGDCNEGDPDAYPADLDGDGVGACDDDCDDDDPAVYPGAEEGCDGIDTDCDGEVPAEEQDADQDGLSTCEGDCDDTLAEVNPDAIEVCDEIDNDCDDVIDDVDADSDGHLDAACGGLDCDDADPAISPDADEICDDGLDNDCDESTDIDDEDCTADDDDTSDDDDDDDTDEPAADDDTADEPETCECRTHKSSTGPIQPSVGLLAALLFGMGMRRRGRVIVDEARR